MPNATRQAYPEAGAQRTLKGVACTRLILIEAPSSIYHRGMWVLGQKHTERRRPGVSHHLHEAFLGMRLVLG
jgi:hypothetical protein